LPVIVSLTEGRTWAEGVPHNRLLRKTLSPKREEVTG